MCVKSSHQTCQNLVGGYRCVCDVKCNCFVSLDVNECEGDGMCVDDGHHTCQNLVGGYRCVCDVGYHHPDDNPTVCEGKVNHLDHPNHLLVQMLLCIMCALLAYDDQL